MSEAYKSLGVRYWKSPACPGRKVDLGAAEGVRKLYRGVGVVSEAYESLGVRYRKPPAFPVCKFDLGAAQDVRRLYRGAGRLGETHEHFRFVTGSLRHAREEQLLSTPHVISAARGSLRC